MKEITESRELREIQLGILNYVDLFCKQHHIQYFLCAGTLIGAIRHKGYIPWDDDIDICMKRDQYEAFFKAFNSCDNGEYKAVELSLDPNYYCTFGKVYNNNTSLREETESNYEIGVNIDIFPLDSLPKYSLMTKVDLLRIRALQRIRSLKTIKPSGHRARAKNLLLKVGSCIFKPFSVKTLMLKEIKISTKHNSKSDPSQYLLDCDMLRYGLTKIYKYSDFDKSVEAEFEGYTFPVPIGYDNALRCIYGDYMTLPPEEKRIAHHSFKAYWKDR